MVVIWKTSPICSLCTLIIINFSIKEAAPYVDNVCCPNLSNILRLALETGTKFKHTFEITVGIKEPLVIIALIYKIC